MIICYLLQERSIADLKDLPFHMASHFACQIQAGIRLIHGVALRAGKIDKMAAVFEHFCTAWLFARFIRQMRRCNRSARCYRIAANVRINQAHSHILRQRIERPLCRGVSCAAEGTDAVDRRNVNDNPVILRIPLFKYLQPIVRPPSIIMV